MPRKMSYADLEASYKAADRTNTLLFHAIQDSFQGKFTFTCKVKERDHSEYGADADSVVTYRFGRLDSVSGGYVCLTDAVYGMTWIHYFEEFKAECYGKFDTRSKMFHEACSKLWSFQSLAEQVADSAAPEAS